MATRFGTSDDAAFQDLIDAHILGSANTLAGIQPSALNLTANCWASLDLQRFTYGSEAADDASRLSYVANALRPALPDAAAAASLVAINEYWAAVTQLGSAQGVLGGAVRACNATGGLLAPALDFTANCSATGDFWWHNVFNATTPRQAEADASWLALFRSSVGPPYRDMSDPTVAAMYASVRSANLSQAAVLPAPLQAALVAAATGCALPACRALEYSGNADMAGVGAVVAYGFIAGVSTLLTAAVAYFERSRKPGHEALRRSAIEAAVAFWDTVVWFGVLACVAGIVYAASKAQTLYEFVICLLVVNLICNSMFLLLTLYSAKAEHLDGSIGSPLRVVPQLFVFVSMYAVTMQTLEGKGRPDRPWGSLAWTYADLQDMPCYAAGLWPMDYLEAASMLQGVLLLSPILLCLLCLVLSYAWILGDCWPARAALRCVSLLSIDEEGTSIVVLLAAAALWVDFAFIIQVRTRARADFGAAYEDDAFGYGQIIAAGIAVQAIYAYFCGVISHLYKSRKERRRTTRVVEAREARAKATPRVLPSANARGQRASNANQTPAAHGLELDSPAADTAAAATPPPSAGRRLGPEDQGSASTLAP